MFALTMLRIKTLLASSQPAWLQAAAHPAGRGVVQALQQRHQRALAAAAEADQRHHAARLQREAHAAQRQHLRPPRVPELDLAEVRLRFAETPLGQCWYRANIVAVSRQGVHLWSLVQVSSP